MDDYLYGGRETALVKKEKVNHGDSIIVSEKTKARIIEAAEKCVLLGNANPTNQDIRKICRASFSHISPVMREWRSLKKSETDSPPIPESIERMGKTTIDVIWDAAIKAANDR
ncbi:MAG: DNA-binding protein, partial [Methyloprofundus sp.]|nr:DNA-binding protein [Methyloprofundus sp.]